MNVGGLIVPALRDLLLLFESRCQDSRNLTELLRVLSGSRSSWSNARSCFASARTRHRRGGEASSTQQLFFEEVVSKTLYNLSGASAPFDADSPYWVVPGALSLAESLDLPSSSVLEIVSRHLPRGHS